MAERTPVSAELRDLKRRYKALLKSDDSALDNLQAQKSYSSADLELWRYPIPQAKHCVFPPYTTRPNPILAGDMVVATTFSPGMVVALDAGAGELRWIVKPGRFGSSSVVWCEEQRLLLISTCARLVAFDLNGREVWSYSPYRGDGEYIYSSHSLYEDRVIMGDRGGCVRCLLAESGRLLWSARITTGDNSQVNCTALVVGDRAVTGCNSRVLAALRLTDGTTLWQQELDGPCVGEIFTYLGGVIARTPQSLYHLSPEGTLLHHWSPEDQEVDWATAAGDTLLVVTRQRGWSGGPSWPQSVLRGLVNWQQVFEAAYPLYSSARVRYCEATRRAYESTLQGLSILNPLTGVREAAITNFGMDINHDPDNEIAHPFIANGVLYALSQYGSLVALRHPPVTEGA